jgi:hypothetical protein
MVALFYSACLVPSIRHTLALGFVSILDVESSLTETFLARISSWTGRFYKFMLGTLCYEATFSTLHTYL